MSSKLTPVEAKEVNRIIHQKQGDTYTKTQDETCYVIQKYIKHRKGVNVVINPFKGFNPAELRLFPDLGLHVLQKLMIGYDRAEVWFMANEKDWNVSV